MKMKTRRTSRAVKVAALAATALLGLSACAGGASAEADPNATYNFTVANAALDGTPHAAVYNKYLDLVEEKSEGRIQFDRTSFEAICDMDEVVSCVRDGRADLGVTVPDYTPQVFPTTTLGGIPFLSTDIQATTAALYEMHTTNEQAMQMMEKNNLHYISTWPVGTLFIGTQEPVENMEDLRGQSVRASGPATQTILEGAGMNTTALTAAETYEALQRDVIDSVASALDFAVNYDVKEQLAHWTDPGLGQYSTYGMWWSTSAYDSLPEDLQAIVDEATKELNEGVGTETYNETMDEVCQGMLDATTVESFTRWDEEATEEWREAAADTGETMWLELASDYGLEDPEGYLEAYRASYESHASEDNPLDASVACVDAWAEQNK